MTDVPEVLDVRDDLERARADAESDVSEDVDEVLALLEEYATREYGDRTGLLDRMENELLRLEEQAEAEATETRFRAARNRVHIYRDAVADASADVGVLNTKLTGADEGTDVAEAGRLQLTAVNEGEPTTGRVVVTFYDEDDEAVDTVRSEPVMFDASEETTVTVEVTTPDRWDYYVATVRVEEAA